MGRTQQSFVPVLTLVIYQRFSNWGTFPQGIMGDLRSGESEVKTVAEVKGTGTKWKLVIVIWPVD